MSRASEFFQHAGIIGGFALLCGLIGFFVPMLFDRDVGGALAATVLGGAGIIFGAGVGTIVVRRNSD